MGHRYKGCLPRLRDLDQPFSFDISLYNRPYRFELYDTASPSNYTLLKPAVIILCYSVADPASLASLKTRWKPLIDTVFNIDEEIPVVVLGLQRDVRSEEDYSGTIRRQAQQVEDDDDNMVLNGRTFTYPQEGLRVAQEMRCDRYCECSALTGELCEAVIEDISRTAAKTTTEQGGKTPGMQCVVM